MRRTPVFSSRQKRNTMEAKNQEPCSSAMWPAWSTLWRLFWLSLWMFSLFGVAASVVRLSLPYLSPHDSGDVVISGLWMRVILFSVGTVMLGGGLWRWRHVQRDIPVAILPSDDCRGSKSLIPYAGLVLGMVFAAVLVFPRLDAWPWAAPDEIYHLTVAKNLALYGEYASGGSETGFKRFDPYDSVGAPVIVPIAAVFRCVGVSVAAGRCVIGVYLLLLSVGAFFLAWRTFGPGAAVMAVLLTPAAFSTIYLARALYGEVPALAWWVWGLLCWRRAVEKPGDIRVGLLAGLAFGLAVLCKSIFVMSAFAFVAVWFWDRMGPRRIPLSAMFFPAVGVAGCIAAWATLFADSIAMFCLISSDVCSRAACFNTKAFVKAIVNASVIFAICFSFSESLPRKICNSTFPVSPVSLGISSLALSLNISMNDFSNGAY